MPDQDGRAGVTEDVVDLFRFEMPVDRHAIGAKAHRGVGGLQEGNVVAHQHADAIALPDADFGKATCDAVGAGSDFDMGTATLAGDDAEEF